LSVFFLSLPTVAHKGNTIIYIPGQKYLLQYNNIYSSTKLIIPVQQYLFQYKINHPSTKVFSPVQIYLSQYKNIFPVQQYLAQYKNIFLAQQYLVQKYLIITEIYSFCKIFPMLHCSPSKVPAKTRWPFVVVVFS